MNYILGSGYYKDPAFAALWWENVDRFAIPKPDRIVIMCVGDNPLPYVREGLSEIDLKGNLGHIHALLTGKDRTLCGWSASVLALAMIAYCNESDLIYKESDCLAFGGWVGQMYEDMGDGDMVFGGKQASPPYMPCSQSLFLVRHKFIPDFIMEYLKLGDERRLNADGKADNLPEDKFSKLRETFPEKIRTLTFGVDRERPLPLGHYVWYGQQFTPEEMESMRTTGLIQ
jgi:hypothetical protein